MRVKKFTLDVDFMLQTNLKNKAYISEFLIVDNQGRITVKAGYSWDGCTPKIKVFGKIIGTPDGNIDLVTGKPKTYYASLVHDVIYENKKSVTITRKESDLLFLHLMRYYHFKNARLYYYVVRLVGWFLGSWAK